MATISNPYKRGGGSSMTATGIQTATTVVNVGSATAPVAGQVLTATSSTAADWETPGVGGAVDTVTAGDTSIVVGGTVANPTIETATLDVIAADHPAAANWSNNTHKITSLGNGSSAQDAAAFGQIASAVSGYSPLGTSTGTSAAITSTSLADVGPTGTVPANTVGTGSAWGVAANLNLTAVGTGTATIGVYWGGIGGTALATVKLPFNAGVVSGAWQVHLDGTVRFSNTTVAQTSLDAVGGINAGGGSGLNTVASGTFATTTGLTSNADEAITFGWKWSSGPLGTVIPINAAITRLS